MGFVQYQLGAHHFSLPWHAERAIADLAEIINRLWGAPSGTPLEREIVVIAWDRGPSHGAGPRGSGSAR